MSIQKTVWNKTQSLIVIMKKETQLDDVSVDDNKQWT